MLPTEAIEFLERHGTYGSQSFDLATVEARLSKEGYSVSKAVHSFLKSYGGLHVRIENFKGTEREEWFHFDPVEALKHHPPGWVVNDYSVRVGELLCVIGEAYRGYMILSMGPSGKVFAGFDEELKLIGNSGEAAIEALCFGHLVRNIP